MAKPFLQCHRRFKNGKDHCYWSIAEKVRTSRGWVQRHLLYLGEINDSQKEAWTKVIDVFDTASQQTTELALYPAHRSIPEHACGYGVNVRLDQFELRRPRQWGACWIGCHLWDQLQLDEFWSERLPDSREGTSWRQVLQTLAVYRLVDPGSEWRLHRQWFSSSAMADLLEADFALAEKDNLYRCLDKLLAHRDALFGHLRSRWEDLFGVKFEILLYDLTSTYFESDPPFPEGDKRQYGYSRDKRPDCVQVVIALVVTPEGFPLAYEVMAGNTADKTTLRGFLQRIEKLHGKAERIWVMDRGIPTEQVLAQMRQNDPPIHYLVGTPKGRLSRYEAELLEKPWQVVREGVQVKLLPQAGELYVLAQSTDRVHKERAMRRRQLKGLVQRLKELQTMELSRDELLMKLGGAKSRFPAAWRLVAVQINDASSSGTVTFALRRKKLREVRRREGRPGLTPRSVLEKFSTMQMLDVHFPTTDGRELIFSRYTQPEKEHKMILAQLGWELPPQSPPRISQKGELLPN